MKNKIFTLLTLLLCLCSSGAWADDAISCSAYLSGTAGTPTTTDCTLAFYAAENDARDVPAGSQVGETTYYKEKINNDANYYVVTLNKTVDSKTYTKFIAGDVVTVYLNANSNTQAYKVGKTAQTSVSASNSTNTNAVYGVEHTLTKAEIEDDGSLRIYRNSSNTHFAGVSVTGTRSSKTPVNLEFASSSGSLDISTASPTLPALTSDPNVTAITSNITYSTSNSAVATVNASTGELTLRGIGTTTITASFGGDATYQSAEGSYTLTVTDATKLGYAEVINPDNKTLAARWLFGIDHASVSQTYGSKVNDYSSRSVTVYLDGTAAANQYTNTNTWYKTVNTSDYDAAQWVGYDITVDDGYVLNLSNIDARLIVSDDCTITWKVVIEDKDGTEIYASGNKTTSRSETGSLNTSLSLSDLTGTVHVKVMMYQGGTTKGFSMDKLILTGTTAVDERTEHTITFAAGEGLGTAPANVSVRDGESYTFPTAPLLYRTGETLTAWNDGTSDHNVGSSMNITSDMNLTAKFTPNTVALGNAATTVEWTFKRGNGAPTINKTYQSVGEKTIVYASQTTIGTTPYDALMTIDVTTEGAKFDNSSNATYAQVNQNTKFTIPAVKNMVVTVSCNQVPSAVSDVTFDGNNATDLNSSLRTLTYTYSGTAETIDIVVASGGLYPDGISVVYPYVQTKYTAPTIVKSEDFNFEHKGYPVTITASEGDLYVSTDGENYTMQASPYVTYATTSTHFYAKATGASYDPSDVVEETVTNTFDGGKSYVAWIYESNYSNAPKNYNVADDEIYKALAAIHNVVLVDVKDYNSSMTDEQKTALNGNLEKADLVVISEAAAGSSKAVIGLEDIVGNVPVLNMKLFAYTYNSTDSKNRWGWATPKNADKAVVAITPVSKYYKVLDGVTFNDDDIALFDYPNEQNHIQYVDEWSAEPSGNVVLANVTVSEALKPTMHASNTLKYFALGISCDDFGKYNANAVTIVKNAAAMLIAGENLDAEIVSGSITACGYNTFSSSKALDLSTLTNDVMAYVATSVNGEGLVVLSRCTSKVPAGTGLLVKGTANGSFKVDVTTDDPAEPAANLFVGMPNGGEVAAANNSTEFNYVFGWRTGEESNPGFYLVNATLPTLAANKAYLHTTTALTVKAEGSRAGFVFDDNELTGIKNIEVSEGRKLNAEDEYYDLSGRRVAQPTRGLYIVNGKKIVIK